MLKTTTLSSSIPQDNLSVASYETLMKAYISNYNKTAVGSSTMESGFVALYVEGKFPTVELDTPSGPKRFKATDLIELKPKQLEQINLIEAIKSGRIACAIIKNGLIETLTVHPFWFDRMLEKQASELAIKRNDEYTYPEENDDISIKKMTESSYLNMIQSLGFGAFIRT